MSPRTGRPPIEDPKKNRVTVRMDAHQNETLNRCAAHFGVPRTEVLCRGLALVEVASKNPNAQQLFDAIEIYYEIVAREKLLKNEYQGNITKSKEQIKTCFERFMKDLN